MSEVARVSYFENYIDTLKKKDEAKRILEEKRQEKQDNRDRNIQHLLTLLYQRKT
jgi:hypothetical protein